MDYSVSNLSMNNQQKYEEFLAIANEFNERLGSNPVLYGSLGLSTALETELETDDIDMLIEHRLFESSLRQMRDVMGARGYLLIDPEENEFRKGEFKVGIATDGDMLGFSGVDPKKLNQVQAGARFRVLTASEYLATYRASSLDGYRRKKRKKNDRAKVELIELLVSAKSS